MAPEYQQTTDKEIQDRVRSKYRASIDQLRALHFEELCFVEESTGALGLSNGPLGLLGVLVALPVEVSRVGRSLRASIFSILMVSQEYNAYVNPFGLGVKFYTSFTDGTCVITANFGSDPINDDGEKLYKFAQPGSIEEAWVHHQNRINDLTAKGKQRKYQLSFDDYVKLAYREDSYMMKSLPFAGIGFVDIGSMFLTLMMLICLLFAAFTMLAPLLIIAHALYPACELAADVDKFALLRSSLIVFACIAFSWLLARVQKNTFTIDAIGTALHGHTPSPDARGYIATKWLVFIFLPILPVRSYQIDGEYSKTARLGSDVMHPLHELHWAQIWKTVWEFRLGYFLAMVFWLCIGVWALYQCM